MADDACRAELEVAAMEPMDLHEAHPLVGISFADLLPGQWLGDDRCGLRDPHASTIGDHCQHRKIIGIFEHRDSACRDASGDHARLRFIARSISRWSSAARLAARLSYDFLWVTSASSTLTREPLK